MNTGARRAVRPQSSSMIRSVVSILLLLLIYGSAQGQEWERFTLPVLLIDTPTGTAIPDEPKLDVRLRVYAPPAELPWWEAWRAPRYRYAGAAGIETRGSSSQRFPKKGYGLELRDAAGEDLVTELLGLPPAADYVLHGPYSDKSLIRNALAYRLGERLDTDAPRTRLVELVIDRDYRGVYLLTERIELGEGHVAATAPGAEGVALTGDYLLKIDKGTGDPGLSGFRSRQRNGSNPPVTFRFDEPVAPTAAQRSYIEDWMHGFEAALAGPGFADAATGYRKYIDVSSFIDYMLLTELARNVDGYRISTYFYKTHDDRGGKLHMGPLWDYNIAFANADYCRADDPEGWAYAYNARCGGNNWPLPMWWERLLEDPAFAATVADRWRALRDGPFSDNELTVLVDTLVAELGPAARHNHQRWQVLGKPVWPNVFVGKDYAAEIEYLKSWLRQRAAWMDSAVKS